MDGLSLNSIEPEDIELLEALQPEGWQDIRPAFRHAITAAYCNPIKVSTHGKIVGLGNCFMHRNTAWLAGIIVHPAYRNRGIGQMITETLIESAKRRVETIYLDATVFGYPIYKKLGFEVETEYIHFKGRQQNPISPHPDIHSFQPAHEQEVLQLDHLISGEHRELILKEQIQHAHIYLRGNQVLGAYFPTLRDGFILANDPKAGLELMKLRQTAFDYAIFPENNISALQFIKSLEFHPYRTSKRMRLGKKRPWRPDCIYNRISGQLG